jgi:hypothetical protein
MKDYPTNKEEYWQFVDQYWEKLANIIRMFAPDQVELAREYAEKNDPRIANIFEESWGNAPDDISIHTIPGWSILCNLCSESYVLDENENSPL